MKRLLLTAAAVMATAGFAFGQDEPVTYPDTIHAMPLVHPDGWSKSIDAAGSSFEKSGAAGEDAVLTLTRAVKPSDGDAWAAVIGAMFPMDGDGIPQGGSLAKLKYVILGYKVEKDTDTLSFGIAKDWNTSTGEPAWNYFHAVSAKGASDPGNFVYDTIALESFFISWAGDNFAEGTLLSDTEAADYLATCNNFVIQQENGDYENEQVFQITFKEINFIGESGLRTDMGLEESSIGDHVFTAKTGTVVNGISEGKLNLTVPAAGSYKVSLFGANGRMIEQKTVSLSAASNQLGVKATSKGVYLVKVEGNGVNAAEKVTLK